MNNEKNSSASNKTIVDISSVSKKFQVKNFPFDALGDAALKNLGNIVKIISFVLAFAVLIMSIVLAFFIISKSFLSVAISLTIIVFGAVFAAIVFFPVYAIGHIICQNNEILEKLK